MKTRFFLISFLVALFTSITTFYIYSKFFEKHQSIGVIQQQGRLVNYPLADSVTNTDFTYAAEKTVHCVVHVKTKFTRDTYYNPLYDFFFGDRGFRQQQSPVVEAGSGVIISNDGYIVTNNHVIEDADDIEVTLNDKRTFPAKIIGTDPTTDISLLKIDAENLLFISYGNSDDLKIGEWVLAVGNQFNLTSTVTAGIVSAKARNINILSQNFAIESFIQTDAAVNPGNSGGALVNTRGELVGINTAIASKTGSYIGYSFAIPVNIVKKIIADIIEFGEVQRAYIGISIQDIDADKAKELGLDKIVGVYVSGATEGGAAKEAGINEGDIITNIGQLPVNSVAELQEQVSKYRPGDKIDVSVVRQSKKKHFEVLLRNKNGNTSIVKTETNEVSVLGCKLQDITPGDKRNLQIRGGAKIVEIGQGKLMKAGVRKGFIITSINRLAVYHVDDFINIINNTQGGVFIEGVYPNGLTAYYAFGL